MSSRAIRSLARSALNLRVNRAPAIPIRQAVAARPIAALAFPSRTFSSTRITRGSGESDAQLSAALAAEHKYEVEESASMPEIPEFLEQFQSQGVWELQDTEGSDDVIIKRKFGSETLTLTFQISDIEDTIPSTIPADGETAPLPPSSPEEDIDGPTEPTYITCSLLITKSGSNNSMAVDMEAGEEGFEVTNVAMFAKALGQMEGAEGDWQRRSRYLGPQFDHLDESVQDAFATFLAERGIDESLSNFILSYSEYKEQKDYVSWLAEVKAFVDQ